MRIRRQEGQGGLTVIVSKSVCISSVLSSASIVLSIIVYHPRVNMLSQTRTLQLAKAMSNF